jgi:uncharacterized protein YigE (DUF2233 family)
MTTTQTQDSAGRSKANKFVMMLCLLLTLLIPSAAAPQSSGFTIRTLEANGTHFTVVSADLRYVQLKMFWKQPNGKPFSSLAQLDLFLSNNKIQLLAAMNAGIYDTNQTPLGLHIERGKVLHRLKTRRKGYGNFYLQPNGVFFLEPNGAKILESLEFEKQNPKALEATQSGPMLVQNNQIHAAFQKNSTNRLPRNAIGVENARVVHLVIADDWVNFYDMAIFMRDTLKCSNALYLDGSISALRIPQTRETQDGKFAGMIGILR